MFAWDKIETEIEVVEEICLGLQSISHDMTLNLICSSIFELDFTIPQVKERMNDMVNATYVVSKQDLVKRTNEDSKD